MNGVAVFLKNVGLSYGERTILHRINANIHSKSFSIVTGESGSGKTSLLRMLYADLFPTWGTVEVLGNNVSKIKDKSILRRRIGVIFQDFKLLNDLTVLENVLLPLQIRDFPMKDAKMQAKKLLSWAGVARINALPIFLSGGEKQRVAIARAVISKPDILIADEPIESLDEENAAHVMHLLWELNKIGMTIVLSTHNHTIVKHFGKVNHLAIRDKTMIIE